MIPDPSELEASLWRDLLDRWFPRCIDPAGGYRQSFGPDFADLDEGARGLVFQSRMVWVCASVADQNPAFAEYARHGVHFLREKLFDTSTGAFVWALGRGGEPTTDERHTYGIAFAIYGLAAASRHLGDGEALEMAQAAFGYLEKYHYDPEFGGYLEATGPDGTPRLTGPWSGDAIGTPFGQKSQNTHLHLLEALTELYRAWPDDLVRQRLQEVLSIFTGPLFAEPGHLVLFTERDWRPAATETSYGHDVEAAHLMLDAEAALGTSDNDSLVMQRARALIDLSLAKGWDTERGGLFLAGDDEGPIDRSKNWWTQAEALLGFAALWSRTGEPRYAEALGAEWEFIRNHQIDAVHGGWFEEVGRPELAKGHSWKAAYHDGRALLFTARLLRDHAPQS